MVERVIIICAGRAERWGQYLGVHKHLVDVDGEVLLDRTLRLVRQRISAPITIVAFDPQFDRPGTERYEPAHGPIHFGDTDKFLSSEPRWSATGQTVILYGDVYFSDAAMSSILTHIGPHRFFGRGEGSYFTGCPYREMFAISFPAIDRHYLSERMHRLRAEVSAGAQAKGGGWELYHYLHGTRWDYFTFIDDFTEDFDLPVDYERWNRRFHNPLHRAAAPIYGPLIKRWRWRVRGWSRKVKRLTDRRQLRLQ